MVLKHVPAKLGHKYGVNGGKYSSTLEHLGYKVNQIIACGLAFATASWWFGLFFRFHVVGREYSSQLTLILFRRGRLNHQPAHHLPYKALCE